MFLPPTLVDMTAQTLKYYKHYRIRDRKSVRIDAVILHQTGFDRGNVPERYLSVHAHFVVMRDGRIVHLHPIETFLVASSAFNEDGISIEFVGNFPDERGNWWKGDPGRHVPTDEQIDSGQNLLLWLRNEYTISFVFAHRQGELENARGNCPGPDIWFNIGEWATREIGLDDGGEGYKEGNGSPIPASWRTARAT